MRHRLRLLDAPTHARRHPAGASPDEAHPDAALVEVVAARHQQALVEAHEEPDLVERAAPVLGGEGVDGHPAQADLERAVDGVEQCLLARRVPVGALQPALLRPATVAVHHDRDVRGDPREIEIGHGSERYLRRAFALVSRPHAVDRDREPRRGAGPHRDASCRPCSTASRPRPTTSMCRCRRAPENPRGSRPHAAAVAGRDLVACGGDGVVSEIAGVAADTGRRLGHRADRRRQRLRPRLGYDTQATAAARSTCSHDGSDRVVDLGGSTAAGTRASPPPVSTPKRTAGRTPSRRSRAPPCTSPRCCAPSPSTSRTRSASRSTTTSLDLDAWLVAVGNGPAYAGGMHITPGRAPRRRPARRHRRSATSRRCEFLRHFPRVFKGTHVTHPKVRTYPGRARHGRVTRPERADGGLRRRRTGRPAARDHGGTPAGAHRARPLTVRQRARSVSRRPRSCPTWSRRSAAASRCS